MQAGELLILRWGNRRGESEKLRPTLWALTATIEAGGWAEASAEDVFSAAAFLDERT